MMLIGYSSTLDQQADFRQNTNRGQKYLGSPNLKHWMEYEWNSYLNFWRIQKTGMGKGGSPYHRTERKVKQNKRSALTTLFLIWSWSYSGLINYVCNFSVSRLTFPVQALGQLGWELIDQCFRIFLKMFLIFIILLHGIVDHYSFHDCSFH